MALLKIKARRKNPDVYVNINTYKDMDCMAAALDLSAKVVGLIALNLTKCKTGFKSDCKTLFADYDKKQNTITITKLV